MWHETLSRQVLSRGRYLRLLTQRCLSARQPARHRAKAPASASFALGGAGGESQRGFTLVEMIVASGLFSVVMLVAVAALLSLVDANRKTQALHSVMSNLNVTLDSMVRAVRMGSDYHCGGGTYTLAEDCATGDMVLAFESFEGDPSDDLDQWVYAYDATAKRIYKSEDSGGHSFAVTAPNVSVDSMTFYVVGTDRGDTTQPKVVIELKGTAGADKVKTRTSFHIQATAVQRILDL